jgi:murein DD-endopeptidase MepM/ murein hydrolase activator NlpD
MLLSPLPGIPGTNYRVTQGFGERPEYYAKYGMAGHNGHDFAPPKSGQKGLVLYAPCDGTVRVKNYGSQGYGLHVVILALEHPTTRLRLEITLGHLASTFSGIDGKFVRALDPIGIMGNTGDSTGVHCHITVRYIQPDNSVQQYNNGYHGAQNIGQFFRVWDNISPLTSSPR